MHVCPEYQASVFLAKQDTFGDTALLLRPSLPIAEKSRLVHSHLYYGRSISVKRVTFGFVVSILFLYWNHLRFGALKFWSFVRFRRPLKANCQKSASRTRCAALKCQKSSFQNTLCRPKVPKEKPSKRALPPWSAHKTSQKSSHNTLCRPKVPKTAPWTRCTALSVTRQNSAGRPEPFSNARFSQVGRFEPETVFWHFKLICAFLKLGMSFWQPETYQSSILKLIFDQPGGKKALGQDLAPNPVKRAFLSTEITSVLVPWNFGVL